jgi:hypothetical protein
MRVLPLLVVAVIVLFFAGLIVPQRSKRLQRWIDDRLQTGKQKSSSRAGFVGDWTAKSLRYGQAINETVVTAGRKVRQKIFGS